jgi:hypothetical protein
MKAGDALNWIIDYLEKSDVPYLVCGGLAAIAYGAKRQLNDIDIYVPKERYEEVVQFGKKYISYGPERFVSEHWNIDYVQFIFNGTKIEVGSSEDVKIFDVKKKVWSQEYVNFDSFVFINLLGRDVRVLKKDLLIEYKRKLDREVDRIDIQQMSSA